MIYGYARVATDGQSVEAQVVALKAAGAVNVYREVVSGAKTDRAQVRGVRFGRRPKFTPYQQRAALSRRVTGEPLTEMGVERALCSC
jgi:hypothetical protein